MILVLIDLKRETRSKLLWIGPHEITLVLLQGIQLIIQVVVGQWYFGFTHRISMPVQVEIIIRAHEEQGQGLDSSCFLRCCLNPCCPDLDSIFNMLSRACNYEPKIFSMQRKRWVSTLVLCGFKWFQAYGVNTELLRNMASKNKNMYRNNQTSWKSAWHKTTRHTKHEHHHQQQSLKHLHPQKTNFMKPLKGFIFGKGNIIVHPAPFPENQRHPEYSGPRSSARRHQVPGIRHAHHGLWVLNQRWRSRSS